MKVTLSEIKKNLQGTNSGVDEAENQVNDLQYKEEKSIQSEQHKEKSIQNKEDRLWSLWDNFKHANIQIVELLEGEEKEQEIEKLFEKIIKENFPSLVREIDVQVQEAQGVPNKMDPKRSTPRHTIIKMPRLKIKRILKAAREGELPTKEFP